METQWQRLLALFLSRGEQGVTISEISDSRPRGLGIKQYNSRIKDLRKQGWNVVCVRPGFFVLRGKNETVRTVEEVKAEYEFLKEVWIVANSSTRPRIERDGRNLAEILSIMEALA